MDRICSSASIIFIISLFICNVSIAENKINVISWWGYISKSDREDIKKACGVNISVDEYFSSSEFLRRWDNKSSDYSITIHSNTIYNSVRNRLQPLKVNLTADQNYHKVVKQKLNHLNLKPNTRLLSIGFTGFLWNKESLNLSSNQSLNEMLDLASNKVVVILDDPMEGMEILDSLNYFKKQLSSKSSKNKAKVIISNDMEHIVSSKDFAFAYHWSGGAIQHMRKNPKKLDFLIHPKLSQVTADLISLNSNSQEALCVFNFLSSEEFTKRIQSETAYFSPYGPSTGTSDRDFKDIYEKYFLELDKYDWLQKPHENDFKMIDRKWKELKSGLSSV